MRRKSLCLVGNKFILARLTKNVDYSAGVGDAAAPDTNAKHLARARLIINMHIIFVICVKSDFWQLGRSARRLAERTRKRKSGNNVSWQQSLNEISFC